MAIELKLKATTSNDCSEIVIQDITGSYNKTSNPGGWGSFNPTGSRTNYTLLLSLSKKYFIKGNTYVEVPISITDLLHNSNFPSETTYRGFKFSISLDEFKTKSINYLVETIATLEASASTDPVLLEGYKTIQNNIENLTTIPDGIFQIKTHFNTLNTLTASSDFQTFLYTSMCNSQKKVNKLLGLVNLGCEDCDDADIDKALLAKSLLDSLKRINNSLEEIK